MFLLWVLIIAVVVGGMFLLCEHLGVGMRVGQESGGRLGMDVQTDAPQDISASGTASVAVPMQNVSNSGYVFSVPATWNIERMASSTLAVHPDAASPDAACKIEVSAFPYSPDTDMADWIAHRIGADPSLAVVEQSSADVSFSNGTGVQWTGTIDGTPTTLVYAFSDTHAYEISPSVVGANANGDGNARCDEMLQTVLSAFAL
jgi:hypothetical protein